MSDHACRLNLAPGLDQRSRVVPDHDVGSSDKRDESLRERKRYDKEPWWLRAYEPDDLHDPLPDDAYITTPAHLVAQHSGDGES